MNKCIEWYGSYVYGDDPESDFVCHKKTKTCSNEFAIKGSEY